MSDFYSELLDDAPVAREVKHNGKTKTVFFRRLTAGERMKLVAGQRMQMGEGKRAMELDLGEVTRNRHMLVQFCNVTEDGKQVFSRLADVQALPEWLVDQLSAHADEVNRDETDAGK